MAEYYNWVLGSFDDNVSSKDWISCWMNKLPPLVSQDAIRYTYNQYKRVLDRLSCTLFASAGCIWDIMNYEYTNEDFNRLNKLSYEAGREKWHWRWMRSAVDLVRDDWNANHEEKVISIRLDSKTDQLFYDALDKWYHIATIFWWDTAYNIDKNKDWILNGTRFWRTYWHAIRLWKNDRWIMVVDSNKWNKYDKYLLANYKWLVYSWTFSRHCYLFIAEKELPYTIKELQAINLLKAIERANIYSNDKLDVLKSRFWVNEIDSIKDTLSEANIKINWL